MLGVVGSNVTIFKLAPTTPNMSQHIAKHAQMLRPTMLRWHVASRLAGELDRESIKNFFILLFCICIKWQV